MNNNIIKVSVIMSLYNETEIMVKQAIDSILNQSYRNFEFIIVLDNPENKSIKNLVLGYQDNRIIFCENETNVGLANSLNKAISLISGEFIARMDADDISLEDRLEKQVRYLIRHPEIDLIGSKVSYIDENGSKIKKDNFLITSEKNIGRLLPFTNLFNHPTWMFRKTMLTKLKGYRAFPSSQDYDFVLRAHYYGYKLINTDDVLLKYRIRENSISVSKKMIQKKMVLYIQKLYSQRKRSGKDNFNLEYVKKISEEKDKLDRFRYADEMFIKSRNLIKDRQYITSYYYLIKSILISRDQFKYFCNLISIKLIGIQNKLTEKENLNK